MIYRKKLIQFIGICFISINTINTGAVDNDATKQQMKARIQKAAQKNKDLESLLYHIIQTVDGNIVQHEQLRDCVKKLNEGTTKLLDDLTMQTTNTNRISNYSSELLPIGAAVIQALLFAYLQIHGIRYFSKKDFEIYKPNTIKETFASVAGNHDAKKACEEIIDYLKNPKKYAAVGAKPIKGILLTGNPGTGKTLLARALAGEANCAFIYASGAEFLGLFQGSAAENVQALFTLARKQRTGRLWRSKTPCIIFIDEFDALAGKRGKGLNQESDRGINQLLTELDGFSTSEQPIILIAATNHPEALDPAILRPGRIDRIIEIANPDYQERKEILQLHLNKVVHDPAIHLDAIIQYTTGFTGADLAELVQSAARCAIEQNASMVTQQILQEALERKMLGQESRHGLNEKEKPVIAYHEAGHALANLILRPDVDVHKITIIPRGPSLGLTYFLPNTENVHMSTKEDYLNQIAVLLAGRAAEEIQHKIISTGPSDDLEKATALAFEMISWYGMGTKLVVHHNEGNFSWNEETEEEVAEILDQQYQRVKTLLQKNIDTLHRLSQALIKHETLNNDTILDICQKSSLIR